MKTIKFPKFWFDSNMYFGWIGSISDLKKAYAENQTSGNPKMTISEFLNRCKQNPNNATPDFGLRTEHSGEKTLAQFLAESGIKLSVKAGREDIVKMVIL